MRYTQEFVKTKIKELETEIETINAIVWCETFECNEYSHDELRALGLLLSNYQSLLDTYRYLEKMQELV